MSLLVRNKLWLVKSSDLCFKLCSKLWRVSPHSMTPGAGKTICPPRPHLLAAVGSHMAVLGDFIHSLLAPDVSCIRGERRRNSRSK